MYDFIAYCNANEGFMSFVAMLGTALMATAVGIYAARISFQRKIKVTAFCSKPEIYQGQTMITSEYGLTIQAANYGHTEIFASQLVIKISSKRIGNKKKMSALAIQPTDDYLKQAYTLSGVLPPGRSLENFFDAKQLNQKLQDHLARYIWPVVIDEAGREYYGQCISVKRLLSKLQTPEKQSWRRRPLIIP